MSTAADDADSSRPATAAAAAALASSTTTRAPCAAALTATASPMPDAPPMMAAVLPSSLNSVSMNSPTARRSRRDHERNDPHNHRGAEPAQRRGQQAPSAAAGRDLIDEHCRHA